MVNPTDFAGERKRRQRERDRQTDSQRQTETEAGSIIKTQLKGKGGGWQAWLPNTEEYNYKHACSNR